MSVPEPGAYGVQMGTACAVHRHRELVPLHVHHVQPLGLGGADVAANEVTLCANGHYSVHALLDALLAGPVPWRVRRRYGLRVRALAERGYRAARGRP